MEYKIYIVLSILLPSLELIYCSNVAENANSTAPTLTPTFTPSFRPSYIPPTSFPSLSPSTIPSSNPSSSQPTSQPTPAPTSPTGQPSAQPSSHPSANPTANPTTQVSLDNYWFYDSNLGSIHYVVCFSVEAFLWFFALLTFFISDRETAKYYRFVISTISFLLWTLLRFFMMCFAFNFLLINQETYLPYETNSGSYYYQGPEYNSVNYATLKSIDCPGNFDHETPDKPGSNSACNFIGWSFSAELVQDGEAKFSIGLGLILYLVLIAGSIIVEYMVEFDLVVRFRVPFPVKWRDEPFTLVPFFLSFLLTSWMKYIIPLVFMSQQTAVLTPLLFFEANQYCGTLAVPTSNKNAVCIYKIAAHAVPTFLYMVLAAVGCFFLAKCCWKTATNDDIDWKCRLFFLILAFYAAIGSIVATFYAVVFFVYYFVIGYAVGLWYQFGLLHKLYPYLLQEILAISIFLFHDIVERFKPSHLHAPVELNTP